MIFLGQLVHLQIVVCRTVEAQFCRGVACVDEMCVKLCHAFRNFFGNEYFVGKLDISYH